MPTFDDALKFVLKWEGGFSETPGDSGGATNYGITHAVYDGYRQHNGLPTQSVKLISQAEVRAIYERQYWTAAHCHEIKNPLIAMAHFDLAVNGGVGRASKTLQKAAKVKVDGVIGFVTLAAVNGADPRGFLVRYLNLREAFYRSIAVGVKAKFLKGWMNRLNDLRKTVGA